jgi:hypothetical protein
MRGKRLNAQERDDSRRHLHASASQWRAHVMLNDAMAKVSSADREHVIGSLLLAVLVSVDELVSTRPWIYDFSRI